MEHNHRTAIVTGGSRGLGRALVRTLAERGWHVVTDGRDAVALDHAGGELAGVVAVPGAVLVAEHRRRRVDTAVEVGGGLDLLVNNAGGLGPSPLPGLTDYPLDELTELFVVNVVAPLGLIQAALPSLVAGDGVVVNITSDASVEAYEGWGGYGATKAALDHVGRVLAVEHPELRVLTVDPGDMRTQMHQDAFPGEDISDRPLPEAAVPGLVALIDGDERTGRHRVVPAEVSP